MGPNNFSGWGEDSLFAILRELNRNNCILNSLEQNRMSVYYQVVEMNNLAD